MREIAAAVEKIWREGGGWPSNRKGDGWSGVAKAADVSTVSIRKWKAQGFPGRVVVHLVKSTGVRGRPVLLEVSRLLGLTPHVVQAMVADGKEWPEQGEWVLLLAGQLMGIVPADVVLLFDATKERPDGVADGQLGLGDDT